MFEKFKKLISLVMVFVFVFSFSVNSFAYQNGDLGDVVSLDGYDFDILANNSNELVLSFTDASGSYVGVFDKSTREITLKFSEFNPMTRSTFRDYYFDVNINNYGYDTSSELRGLILVDSNGLIYENNGVSSRISIPIGWSIVESLLRALLAAALAMIINGEVFVVLEEAVSNLRKESYRYFDAVLMNRNVWIGKGLTTNQAKSRVMRNSETDGVFALSASYARGLASGLGGATHHCAHGTVGYYDHYHAAAYTRSHIWFL